MTTLRVHTRGDHMVIEAVDGPVSGISCEVHGPNVNPLHNPARLAPDDGAVIVAVRTRNVAGGDEVGSVKVRWEEDGERRSIIRRWT